MKSIVLRPVITEKSLQFAQNGVYTFAVTKLSTKPAIAGAISKVYGVTVTGVRTIAMHGKSRRVGRRMKTIRSEDWKKALVTVKSGQKIDVFELTGSLKNAANQVSGTKHV